MPLPPPVYARADALVSDWREDEKWGAPRRRPGRTHDKGDLAGKDVGLEDRCSGAHCDWQCVRVSGLRRVEGLPPAQIVTGARRRVTATGSTRPDGGLCAARWSGVCRDRVQCALHSVHNEVKECYKSKRGATTRTEERRTEGSEGTCKEREAIGAASRCTHSTRPRTEPQEVHAVASTSTGSADQRQPPGRCPLTTATPP